VSRKKRVPKEQNHYYISASRFDDLVFVLETDNNVIQAIKRCGFPTPEAAEKYCRSRKRYDLAAKIRFYALNGVNPYGENASEFYLSGRDGRDPYGIY